MLIFDINAHTFGIFSLTLKESFALVWTKQKSEIRHSKCYFCFMGVQLNDQNPSGLPVDYHLRSGHFLQGWRTGDNLLCEGNLNPLSFSLFSIKFVFQSGNEMITISTLFQGEGRRGRENPIHNLTGDTNPLSFCLFDRLEMTEILLKGRKTLTHPSICLFPLK